MPTIDTGTLFFSWENLKEEIENWAVSDHFSYNVIKKDQSRVDYRCSNRKTGCLWRVFASVTKEAHEIRVKIVQGQHTCAGAGEAIHQVSNTQSWLRRTVPKHLFVTRNTEVREIMDCMRMHYDVKVNQEAARIARASLVRDRIEHQREQFKQIPAYLALLHSKNPLLHTELHTTNGENTNCPTFQRVFICPVQSQLSFIQMRKFLAVDGTFLKARFIQTLLLAVGIDGNGQNLILAWAVVESENTSSWTWFLSLLKQAIPQTLQMTLISDRDKGLLAADKVTFGEGVDCLICCFHLKGNFCKRYSRVLGEKFFWPIANARTTEEYTLNLERLAQVNMDAADYLSEIDLSLWVTAYFTGRSFGHKTSNIVESMNNMLKRERELSILDLLNEIWHLTMAQRFKRFTEASRLHELKNQIYTDFCLQELLKSRKWAMKNTVRMSSQVKGEVNQANDRVYVVDLDLRTCDCRHFQENGIPCGHAFSCIYELGKSPRDYVPEAFTITTWRNTYLTNLAPITLDDLSLFDTETLLPCNPPSKQRAPMGRPQVIRMTPGSQRKRIARAQASLNGLSLPIPQRGSGSQSCRICGEYGHNRVTCPEK